MRVANPHGTLDPELVIPHYRDRLVSMANSLRVDLRDELVQVGMIGMWRALLTYQESKGALPSYLVQRARWDMVTFLRKRSENDVPVGLMDTDEYSASLGEESFDEELSARIWDAVMALPDAQRKYTVLRFYEGADTKLLTEIFGYNPNPLWNSKGRTGRYGAKFKLADALADLA